MPNFKYFAEQDGQTVQLDRIRHDGHISVAAHHFSGIAPDGSLLTAARKIEFKSNPSRHACDDRCVHATGRTMRCECSCGGKNHGRGH